MQNIMEIFMQLMKISIVPYMMKNYVKNSTQERENVLDILEREAEREKPQNSVLICLESSRMIFDIFTLC